MHILYKFRVHQHQFSAQIVCTDQRKTFVLFRSLGGSVRVSEGGYIYREVIRNIDSQFFHYYTALDLPNRKVAIEEEEPDE